MDMGSETNFSPDIARQNHSFDYLKMKESSNHFLPDSDYRGQSGYGNSENNRLHEEIHEEEIDDTSLDHYIPCFVKKIKGRKPFLIDIQVAGSFRDLAQTFSSNTSSNYQRQYNSRIKEGSFRDFNSNSSPNPPSRSPNPRDKEIHSTSYQPACGPRYGNNYRNNNGNNYVNSYAKNYGNNNQSEYENNYGNNYENSYAKNYGNNNRNEYENSYGNNSENNYANNYGNNNRNEYENNYGNNYENKRATMNRRNNNYSGRNNYSNKNNHNNYSNRNKEISVRGPRAGKARETQTASKGHEYNKKDFVINYDKARFFMIKSFSENDVYNSMKYNVWSSTPHGNKKLDSVYRESRSSEDQSENYPIFLFFSVNSSGQFVGMAEMTGLVDFEKNMDFWLQDRWNGFFPIKWHIIKDIPNYMFRDITLENNENKVVTFCRDTQEILLPQGLKMLRVFKEYEEETSLLDDFEFYKEREKERWANKNNAASSRDDDDLFGDLSVENLEEEMRRMSFPAEKRY